MDTPTEATITLSLSEYEASIITGALAEFGEHWPEERHTATYLRERILPQLPGVWRDEPEGEADALGPVYDGRDGSIESTDEPYIDDWGGAEPHDPNWMNP